jgi:hypothetical protein
MNVAGPGTVFVLCLFTSIACTWLLTRAWLHTRTKLLLWSAIAFGFLAFNNALLVLDVMVIHNVSLLWARQLSALAAVCVLIYGFIWEVDR